MGAELLIGLALAFIVLGPNRMHSMIAKAGRAKAQFEQAIGKIKAEFAQVTVPAHTVRSQKDLPSR
jgi:Sec-independent protein translocase protein TatA